MSFNYLEVAKAAEQIQGLLPLAVENIELVEFPIATDLLGGLPDLNVGLRLGNAEGFSQTLVFSLRQPWTGLFFMRAGAFRSSKQTWAKAFDAKQDWNPYLKGQQLESLAAIEGDRIVELSFSNGAALRVELFPARPNWVLDVSGQRFEWRDVVLAEPGAASESPLSPSALRSSVVRSVRPFENANLPEAQEGDWMARAYRHYFDARVKALYTTQLQRGLSHVQSRLSQLLKIRGHMETSLGESSRANQFREWGERLKAVLYTLPKDHRADKIVDEKGAIVLDAKQSLAENANRFFQKYKKLERTKREVEARFEGIESERALITKSLAALRVLQKPPTAHITREDCKLLAKGLLESGIELKTPQAAPSKQKKVDKKWKASGLRQFLSAEGLHVWVGQDHVQNEELVIRLARGNDMWLHLKGRPGAHVVIQIPNGRTPSLETLLDAATLVAYYSDIKTGEKADVDYTFRKYVKRVSGKKGSQFLVTYSQNKTLVVKIEETRLWRLLKQH